jgi:uncharacterized protein
MNYPKFELFKSPVNNQFYFRLKAPNGEIILSSEGYTSKQSCEGGIASVKINATDGNRYERHNNMSSYTFNLKAANNEVIGRSESYANAFNRDQGIATVMTNAPYASIYYLN